MLVGLAKKWCCTAFLYISCQPFFTTYKKKKPKLASRKGETYDVLSLQRENGNDGTKILGKRDISKETKGKMEESCVTVAAPVYLRTIERNYVLPIITCWYVTSG